MKQERRLQVDPALIFDVISKQAGSLGKAILESVMNSVDADATRCDITLSQTTYTVEDDGKGFLDMREIERFFETFGTPHEKGDAKLGRFRIGRGQGFSFSRNQWRSGDFFMDVDLKNRGLDWTLETMSEPREGCHITGKLYAKLTPSDYQATIRELKEQVAWSPIPVTLNGELISKDISTTKWDHEDENCMIKFQSSGGVKIYNLGFFVRNYHASQYGGSAAIVVSKKQLEVNFARNDVLLSQCDIFKSIKKVLVQLAMERTGSKKTKMTNDDRRFLIQQWISGDASFDEIGTKNLLPQFPSRFMTLQGLVCKVSLTPCKYGNTKPGVVLQRGDNDRIAEQVHQSEQAFVFKNEILDWFDVYSIEELNQLISSLIQRDVSWRREIQDFFVDLPSVSKGVTGSHQFIKTSQYEPREKILIQALSAAYWPMLSCVAQARGDSPDYGQRRDVRIGLSDSAHAWTNGKDYICLNRSFVDEKVKTFEGLTEIVLTMVHEYVHDESDEDSHVHGEAFYETYHNAILRNEFGYMQLKVIGSYVNACLKKGLRVPADLRKSMDGLFTIAQDIEDAAERAA